MASERIGRGGFKGSSNGGSVLTLFDKSGTKGTRKQFSSELKLEKFTEASMANTSESSFKWTIL